MVVCECGGPLVVVQQVTAICFYKFKGRFPCKRPYRWIEDKDTVNYWLDCPKCGNRYRPFYRQDPDGTNGRITRGGRIDIKPQVTP